MIPPPRVCVIIATWNSRDLLERCLTCLKENTDYPNWQLWIVDNASTDGTSELVRDIWPTAHFIRLGENRGSVHSFNLIVGEVEADYYIRLDTDAFVQEGWLWPLVRAAEGSDDIGFASSKFFYPDGTIHYAGASLSLTLGIRVFGHGETDMGQYKRAVEVPFAHAMCLVKKRVIDIVGGLDERFSPGYYEELDYQLRARLNGFRVIFVPQSKIIHETSGTFRRLSSGHKIRVMERNWLQLLALHWPISLLFARLPIEGFRIAHSVLSSRRISPYIRAWKDVLGTRRSLRYRRVEIVNQGSRRLDFRLLMA